LSADLRAPPPAGSEGDGIHEDTVDTLHMIRSNGHLAVLLLVQMAGLLAYNYMGMHVTGHLGAVFRTVLETMRTLFVWLVGLLLFYVGTGLGEAWDRWSPVQALGFLVLVAGTIVYGRGDERAAELVRAAALHPVCLRVLAVIALPECLVLQARPGAGRKYVHLVDCAWRASVQSNGARLG
jgi:hypothetical protein